MYWPRPSRSLAATAGMHRTMWDLHYTPLPGGRGNYPIAAVPFDTAQALNSLWVAPGKYTIKLTVDGKSYTQPMTVKMDPRVKTSVTDLTTQFTLSKQLYDDVLATQAGMEVIRGVRSQLAKLNVQPGAPTDAIGEFDKKALAIEGQPAGFGRGGGGGGGGRGAVPAGPETLSSISGSLTTLLGLLQGADAAPTAQLAAAITEKPPSTGKLLPAGTSMNRARLTPRSA